MRTHRFLPLILAAGLGLIAVACGNDTTETATTTTTSEPTTSQPPAGGPDQAALATLEPNIGCGDAAWSFSTPDDDLLLRVVVPDLLRSIADEGVVDRSYDLADPGSGATVVLEAGTKLGTTECNDVVEGDYEVTGTWAATAGTVRLEIPEVPAGPLELCLTPVDTLVSVDGVTFDTGETISTGKLELATAVGWCPG